ncbi:PTS system, nitrogen regulatory IIA component [Mesorhizobium albiziae]|uniref:PTS system, nitrogen regulatory IIA component n=1 Tax=Neomesorhizobium albiziae TaxID=335020 RepID=A0A1I3V300_9HYPH|nr:PTS sugar transporter subunit IIA [Mesorhizobium albiziae]GLS28577.1 PTS IIA-like nitrogen-regulatory protein PtsN [Mesorhizobium albiziae]SFJ88511.1 PTS system, nitrogen regulatory IIA component [Mesorhizobium albiziae]
MDIHAVFARDDIRLGVEALTKPNLLRHLARHAAERTSLPAATVLTALAAREKLGSTGLGDGIAIPHARLAGLQRPFGLAIRLKEPCDFEAMDGEPVDLVVLLLVPPTMNSEHLTILSRVARTLRDPVIASQLRRAPDRAAFLERLKGEGSRERAI